MLEKFNGYLTRFRAAGYFLRHYGILKVLTGAYFYHYRLIRQMFLDLSKEHRITVNECEMVVMPQDKGISSELLIFKIHEPLSTNLILNNLKKNMTCIDIGSNIGYYAILESKIVGKNGKVFAIEPSPQNYIYLQKNADLQKSFNLKLYNFAGSDSDGEINFHVDPKSNWSRVIDKDVGKESNGKIIKINSQTLDSFIHEQKILKVDFIRMDVEGYEFNIYKGMKNAVKIFKPVLMMEIHKDILGIENTKKFLNQLILDEYYSQFYIPRALDNPILADKKFITNYSLKEILRRLSDDSLPSVFTLYLKNSKA